MKYTWQEIAEMPPGTTLIDAAGSVFTRRPQLSKTYRPIIMEWRDVYRGGVYTATELESHDFTHIATPQPIGGNVDA